MSKGLLQVVDRNDFLKASRIEKFHLVLREVQFEELLTQQEYEYWQRLQQAFALTFKQFDQTKAIRVIRNQIPGCERYETARRLYDDMGQVYGPFLRRNKELARAILVQRLWSLGVRLEQAGKHFEAATVYEKAGQFEGLDKHDQVDFDPADLQMPELTISNDPRYLRAQDVEIVDENEPGEDGLL